MKAFGFLLAACVCLGTARIAAGQGAGEPAEPKLNEPFVFNLRPQRDDAVQVVAQQIQLHDDALQAKELEAANASLVGKTIELLRYIPIRAESSESDDFFTPNYLRPGYAPIKREANLFNAR